jgi:fructose-1,6-bisphosphatase/inositol monophosphatase family enzyme
MEPIDRHSLAEVACHAARTAAEFVEASRPARVERKPGGHSDASRVVTEVDRRSEEIILELLQPSVRRHSLGVLTEERHDDGSRLRRDHFWSVDPLDGTLPYIEARPGYAVSIALVSREGVPEIGVIADPVRDHLFCAIRGGGITRNGEPWSPCLAGTGVGLSVFADRSLLDSPHESVITTALDRESLELGAPKAQIELGGGAVMNACQALESPAGCYFKFPRKEEGGGALWDFAATACLYGEAGAVATNIHGGPLDLNRADGTWMNHEGVLFATSSAIAARITAIYRDWSARSPA